MGPINFVIYNDGAARRNLFSRNARHALLSAS